MTRRLAIFAHYDGDGLVRPYVIYHLAKLREVCDEILFVTTAELRPGELEKAAAHAARAYRKQNIGYDFHMWKDALAGVDLAAWDELVLTNSSVLGPLGPLADVFDRMAGSPCDFWGMTDNAEFDYHLQSYFLVFRAPVLRSPVFREFFGAVLAYKNKNQVIRSYEIGLTHFLREHGFTSDVVGPFKSLALPPWQYKRRRRNPTCFNPVAVLKLGVPYVKLELLRDNPVKVKLGPVYAAIQASGYDMSLVEFDLRRG